MLIRFCAACRDVQSNKVETPRNVSLTQYATTNCSWLTMMIHMTLTDMQPYLTLQNMKLTRHGQRNKWTCDGDMTWIYDMFVWSLSEIYTSCTQKSKTRFTLVCTSIKMHFLSIVWSNSPILPPFFGAKQNMYTQWSLFSSECPISSKYLLHTNLCTYIYRLL